MEKQILDLLSQIETEKDVKIIYARESGSRAWGFPSPDSDYDFRFIYMHPRDWYLSVNEETDHIRVMPNELLDGNGWDFRKFLRLMHASNSSVFEWLHSPIVYREDTALVHKLRELAVLYFQPKKIMHHFLGIATSMLKKEFMGDKVKIKKYFYVLRPVLSACWVAEHGSPPPVDFYKLLPLIEKETAVYQEVMTLLKQKETAKEGHKINRSALLDGYLKMQMERCEDMAKSMEKPLNNWHEINYFYRETLEIK